MNFLRGWFVCSLFVLARPLAAHEYWVEPLDFTLKPGQEMQAYLKVGQDFNGSTYPYVPQRFVSFTVTSGGKTVDYKGTAGNSPALQIAVPTPGLNVIAYHSQPDSLTFRKQDLLEKYLKAEGLEWVLEQHRADGLPEVGFKEHYTRNAKALVQVGPYAGGVDKAVGMPFELVVQGSPYDGSRQVKVQLLWRGKPVAGYPVNVFTKRGSVKQTRVQTDANGMADVAFPKGAQVMLNSVWIVRGDVSKEPLYESWWASLTFGR